LAVSSQNSITRYLLTCLIGDISNVKYELYTVRLGRLELEARIWDRRADGHTSTQNWPPLTTKNITSGYATWFTARGAIRIAHYDVIDDVITRKL